MPKEAAKLGAAKDIISLDDMASYLVKHFFVGS
jgi:chemotaxis response regulator CheB